MTASIILKRFIYNPLKKAVNWYFEKTSGSFVCMTGTFPIEYYEQFYSRQEEGK